jgi:hypothetical protein
VGQFLQVGEMALGIFEDGKLRIKARPLLLDFGEPQLEIVGGDQLFGVLLKVGAHLCSSGAC